MTEHTFEVRREMHGDKEYEAGDTRKLTALEALPLVRSGALAPKGKEAREAIEQLMADSPDERDGIIQSVKADAPNNKDAGNAPRNKADGGATPTPTPAATPTPTPAATPTPTPAATPTPTPAAVAKPAVAKPAAVNAAAKAGGRKR